MSHTEEAVAVRQAEGLDRIAVATERIADSLAQSQPSLTREYLWIYKGPKGEFSAYMVASTLNSAEEEVLRYKNTWIAEKRNAFLCIARSDKEDFRSPGKIAQDAGWDIGSILDSREIIFFRDGEPG